MPSTLVLLFIFNVYNPNLQMIQEKRFLIEFLETGGLINLEHSARNINAKLFRNLTDNVQGALLVVSGLGLCSLSI